MACKHEVDKMIDDRQRAESDAGAIVSVIIGVLIGLIVCFLDYCFFSNN